MILTRDASLQVGQQALVPELVHTGGDLILEGITELRLHAGARCRDGSVVERKVCVSLAIPVPGFAGWQRSGEAER